MPVLSERIAQCCLFDCDDVERAKLCAQRLFGDSLTHARGRVIVMSSKNTRKDPQRTRTGISNMVSIDNVSRHPEFDFRK